MASRLNLHSGFVELLGTGTQKDKRVYFNPPASKNMTYPCIRYSLGAPRTLRANNKAYGNTQCYEGVVIDLNPDSTIPVEILTRFPMCSLGKAYTVDNLNHFPFTIFY